MINLGCLLLRESQIVPFATTSRREKNSERVLYCSPQSMRQARVKGWGPGRAILTGDTNRSE